MKAQQSADPGELPAPAAAITAAIVATSSEFWSEAAELWFDLTLWRPTAAHAWPFAAEAALRCGDHGLADQMLARRAAAVCPEWLEPEIARARPIRAGRLAHFSSDGRATVEQLLALALHRDAIRAIAADASLDEAATRGWLVRAHHGLGEHERVCEIGLALTGAPGAVADAIAHSRACARSRAAPLAWHRGRFSAAHPGAGIVDWLDR